MKIVADTNIFISSFFFGGNPRKVIERVINGDDRLFICKEILHEMASVMARSKFNVGTEYITRFIRSIEDIAHYIAIAGTVQHVCRDSEDNKILECALLSNADYIITGDRDLLILKEFRGIKILTASEYLKYYSSNN
jgi:putative PIN family toxin of toxin-antitoxin system